MCNARIPSLAAQVREQPYFLIKEELHRAFLLHCARQYRHLASSRRLLAKVCWGDGGWGPEREGEWGGKQEGSRWRLAGQEQAGRCRWRGLEVML